MKKINPKDLEVNPRPTNRNMVSHSKENKNNERETTVCSDDNWGCVTPTLAIDCTVDTGYSICKCPTLKNCVNTVDGCADTVSKGELCCALSDKPTCNCSIRCESKEYCPVTEDYNCKSEGTQCIFPQTDNCELHTDTCVNTSYGCGIETGEKCQNTEQGAGCNVMSDDPGECQIISANCID